MANSQALTQLRDIHLPKAISWWPLAPGWYLLLIVLLTMGIVLSWLIHRHHQKGAARREALRLLNEYRAQHDKTPQVTTLCAQINALLKRVALVYYPRADVASLQGEPWFNFLNNTSQGYDFRAVKDLLIYGPYQANSDGHVQLLITRAEQWIKQRRQHD